MSPFYKQDSVGIHFTWKKNWKGVQRVLPLVEDQLMELGARPHWGKIFKTDSKSLQNVSESYARFNDFKALVAKIDGNGKFQNPFLEDLLRS